MWGGAYLGERGEVVLGRVDPALDQIILHHRVWRDWYSSAEQPAPAPHLAHPEGRAHPERCAAMRMVLVTGPRVSRSWEHFPDGFDLHLQQIVINPGFRGSTVLHQVVLDRIRTSIYDKHSSSKKITTHLDHTSHC